MGKGHVYHLLYPTPSWLALVVFSHSTWLFTYITVRLYHLGSDTAEKVGWGKEMGVNYNDCFSVIA